MTRSQLALALDAVCRRRLLPLIRKRIAALVDFDAIEPREFWRRAVREALAESNFDPNPLIGALFDPDELGCSRDSDTATVETHIEALEFLARRETHADILAAAAVLLAVSLGYSPADAMESR